MTNYLIIAGCLLGIPAGLALCWAYAAALLFGLEAVGVLR